MMNCVAWRWDALDDTLDAPSAFKGIVLLQSHPASGEAGVADCVAAVNQSTSGNLCTGQGCGSLLGCN